MLLPCTPPAPHAAQRLRGSAPRSQARRAARPALASARGEPVREESVAGRRVPSHKRPAFATRDASQARRTNAEVFDALARRAFAAAQAAPRDRRFVVGLAGCPGSGKTTTAAAVVARCNALAAAQGLGSDWAALLPMDGFHLYRRQLDAMPDPAEAHRRRGTIHA
jgi:hypothetical protein